MTQKLSTHRARRALTIADLAELAGVSNKTIVDIEGGKTTTPHSRTVMKITTALGVEPKDVLEFSGVSEDEEIWRERFDRLAAAVMREDSETRDRILRNLRLLESRE